MSQQPETQDLEFSIPIASALSALYEQFDTNSGVYGTKLRLKLVKRDAEKPSSCANTTGE
jgi:hypothetical protein